MKMFTVVASLLVLLAAGCASQPPAPIRVDLPTDLQIGQVLQAPDNYQGSKVRWGGVIANITNLKSETELEVVAKPLDKSARPVIDSKSSGRFLVRISGFLEPTEFTANREITVVGQVSGAEARPIGEFNYTYPLIQADSYHLWEGRVEPVYYYYDPWFYDPWYWGYPRYPWWYYY